VKSLSFLCAVLVLIQCLLNGSQYVLRCWWQSSYWLLSNRFTMAAWCIAVSHLCISHIDMYMLIESLDLNSGSVIWGKVPLDKFSRASKYKYIGRPKKRTIAHQHVGTWRTSESAESPRQITSRIQNYLRDFGLSIKAETEIE
jgi:hypothetical protein